MLLILIFGDDSAYTLIALSAAVIHEAGHIITGALLGIKFKTFSLSILGAKLALAAPLYSYKREWLLCASGPAINYLTGGAAAYIYYNVLDNPEGHMYVLFFAIASFFLGTLNLLPIKNFDGGRMLICTAAPLIGIYAAEKLTDLLSFIFVLVLWAVSLYLMLRVGASLALFVFSSALFIEMFFDARYFS